MANATATVKRGAVRRTDEFINLPLVAHTTRTVYYANAAIGLNTSGYVNKLDDTASYLFVGLVREELVINEANSAGDASIKLHQPLRFEAAFSSIARTDIGKKVYASDDQTFVITSGTTYGNLVGILVERISATIGLVEGAYDGVAANKRLSASRVLAATGAQTVTKWDLNKTIFLPNTATYTATLPAVADTQAGDRLHFVKTTSDAAAVTLDGAASETIDGATTLATLDAQYDCATLVSTGAAWIVENRDIA